MEYYVLYRIGLTNPNIICAGKFDSYTMAYEKVKELRIMHKGIHRNIAYRIVKDVSE